MFCPKCGKQLVDGARFCASCGAQLEGTQAQSVVSVQIPPAPKRGKKSFAIGAVAATIVVVAVLVAVYLNFLAPYEISERAFPDSALRSKMAEQLDADGDGKIERSEAQALTSLDLSGADVRDLQGLQVFANLESLDLSDCAAIETLEFGGKGQNPCPNLTSLNISGSGVVTLDVGSLTKLAELIAAGCPNLKAVQLGGAESLRVIDLSGSGVSDLDASGLAVLEHLNVRETGMDNANVAGDFALADLRADDQTAIVGLDDTPLQETWLLASFTDHGKGENMFDITTYFEYDDAGVLMRSLNQGNTVDECSYYTDFTYDENGRLTKRAVRKPNESEDLSWIEYHYEEGGLPTEAIVHTAARTQYKEEFRYDESGRLVESINAAGSTRYTYDGDRLSLIENTVKGVKQYLLYDDRGELRYLGPSSTGDQAKMEPNVRFAIFEFDGNGRVQRCATATGSVGDVPLYTLSYDESGSVSEIDVGVCGLTTGGSFNVLVSPISKVTCAYDANGNLVDYKTTYVELNKMTSGATMAYTRCFSPKDAGLTPSIMLSGDFTQVPTFIDPAIAAIVANMPGFVQVDVAKNFGLF